MRVERYPHNPIITPADVTPHHADFEVIAAFNAGVAVLGDETILLLRVAERPHSPNPQFIYAPIFAAKDRQLQMKKFDLSDVTYDYRDPRVISLSGHKDTFEFLTSLSYFRVARSKDGYNFTVDTEPFMYPESEFESFGIEDARVTKIENTFYITYSMVSPMGIGVGLASTTDFRTVQRHGMVLAPENKDGVLFPETIDGKYYALHRPVPKSNGQPEVWIAESLDLIHWGQHQPLFGLRPNSWDSDRIGAGFSPIATPAGWLELYHGADKNSRYCMGAILLDKANPRKVLSRTKGPILEPTQSYEVNGFFGNVVFGCGAVVHGDGVQMYYGVADTSMACCTLSLSDIMAELHS
ncbi:glycosidase [Alicyclobacillaceae bacterium I2511]|jgi:predicted GH43/DUF377 family glycosyl hydrolase|nr:glycosidase [Alicyclobacillaceae bacterium I2511]